MHLAFHGGAGTVTGSKVLISTNRTRLLVDCGLFQGLKQLRLRNWQEPGFAPAELDAVVLTHAHLDHSGWLPLLVRKGFSGPVWCTPPTRALASILLADAGRIQEEDAAFANEHGFSKHHPALPLYTEAEAHRVERHFRTQPFDRDVQVGDLTVRLVPAGHILGAASVLVSDGASRVLVSGDLGRARDLIMRPPARRPSADWVVMESTYGDREHGSVDPVAVATELLGVVQARRCVLVIPSFAVGRTQSLLLAFHRAFAANPKLRVPLYVDSPMAASVTEVYRRYPEYHRLQPDEYMPAFDSAHFVRTIDDSKALDRRRGPMVIIAASGMLTGGRVLHHLQRFAPDPNNLVLLPGYQAPGTRGAALVRGERALKIHGAYTPIRAEVRQLHVLSAHADRVELLDWLAAGARPTHVVLVHGDPEASDALRRVVRERLDVRVTVAEHGAEMEVEGGR